MIVDKDIQFQNFFKNKSEKSSHNAIIILNKFSFSINPVY